MKSDLYFRPAALLMVSSLNMDCTTIDFELLTEDLSNAPWHVSEIFSEIDDCIQLFPEEEVNSGVDIHLFQLRLLP